jgi:uncharacterized protein YdeI (YjbR/CyaY-like superfamily)
MAAKKLNTLEVKTISQWHAWLAKHHDSVSEVWLVFHKRQTGRPSIPYSDALDEALCFGWIDSLIKRLDEERYARKFTPRKPDSAWSAVNRKRYAELEASGRLAPAGRERPPTSRSYGPRPAPPSKVPPYIQKALQSSPAARQTFERLAPSYRLHYVMWINMAKQEHTRLRRLREAIELLAAGKKLGLK